MTPTDFDARSYWDKRLKRRWSLHGVGMLRLSHRYNRWMYRVRRHAFHRMVRKMHISTPQSNVLDVGAGTGFYINLWQRLGANRVSGVDIADSAVDRLRKKYPEVRFERADISDEIPFPDDKFDIISAFDVLFHIVDDDRYVQAINNIHRMLNPGGWLIFSEHFVAGYKTERTHYVSRSRQEIEDILRRNGFDIISRRPVFVSMAPPYSATRRWRRNLWAKGLLPAIRSEHWGGAVGAALYPVELLLTRLFRESQCLEIMICRKIHD